MVLNIIKSLSVDHVCVVTCHLYNVEQNAVCNTLTTTYIHVNVYNIHTSYYIRYIKLHRYRLHSCQAVMSIQCLLWCR